MKLKFVVTVIFIFHFSLTLAQTNPPPSVVQSILQSANEGGAEQQFGAAVLYDNGQGVPKNELEAIRWYRLSAEQGYDRAQYALGMKYFYGRGVSQSYTDAFRWYRSAAVQGHSFAQGRLALLYSEGLGVPQSMVLAYVWFSLSAVTADSDRASDFAAIRDQYATFLSLQALEQAQALATRCFDTDYKDCQ
jgi:TPR repeat protein